MFWTDSTQAAERLTGTVVNYDNKPVYVQEVLTSTGDASCYDLSTPEQTRKRIPLGDEKWMNFRDLPRLGWFNYLGSNSKILPMYLERQSYNCRSHGLTQNNTKCSMLTGTGLEKSRGWSITDTFGNPGYIETCQSEELFPKLSEILMALDDSPGGVAFHSKFCVVVTDEGMKWLYRKNKRIGFFTGTDSLNLFPKLGYYKEELQKCPSFDIANVKEF